MGGLQFKVFGILVLTGLCVSLEHQCSKYHYEEQILSKQIRMEIRLENLENKLKEVHANHHEKTLCDDEWIPFQSSCYWFGTTNVDFEHAKTLCELSGSHLVSIHSVAENDFITRHVSELSAPNFWIGLTDAEKEGTWLWSGTNSKPRFLYWSDREPNGGSGDNCAAIFVSHKNKWVDEPCTNRQFRAICKK